LVAVDSPISRQTLDDIAAAVCQNYGLDKADLINTSQSRRFAEAWPAVGWLAKTFENAALTEVGASFNRGVGMMSFALRRLVQRSAGELVLKVGMEKLQVELKEKLGNLEA
jgi:hypothetical protein